MRRFALAIVLALTFASPAYGQEFADWTSVDANTAEGTLLGNSVALAGSSVVTAGSVVDGSATDFDQPYFTPRLPLSDRLYIEGFPGFSYTLAFGAPVQDPVLHVSNLASTLQFPAGTQIVKVSGQDTFTVSGSAVVGSLAGSSDASGTVRIAGVHSSLTFTAVPVYSPPSSPDGIYLQAGGSTPPPPGAPPAVQDIAPATPPAKGGSLSVTAAIIGIFSALNWDLNGDGRPDIVSGPGQDTLRFRPTGRNVTVSVQPVGPGGFGNVTSKSFAVLRAENSVLGRRVTQLVSRRPPVITVGSGQVIGLRPGAFIGELKQQPCFVGTTVRAGSLEARGCLRPITNVAEIPPAERGVLDELARGLGLADSSGYVANVNRALNLLDGYISKAGEPVTVNGVKVTPRGNASVVVLTQDEVIASSAAALSVGGVELGSRRRFAIDTARRGGAIALGSFPRIGGLSQLAGFGLVDDVRVTLAPPGEGAFGASVEATLKLPSFLRNGPLDFTGRVKMRADNDRGLIVDNLRIGPANAHLGALEIQQLQLDYTDTTREWRGQGKACLITGQCLNMIPDKGGVVIAGDELKSAGATLEFGDPGLPIYPGMTLRHVGFNLARDPTRMVAGAGIKAFSKYDIDGRLVLAFPSSAAPFVLDAGEVGPGFPPAFYGRRFDRLTVGGTGAASMDLPVFGRMPLAGGYFLYEYPDYVAFGGGMDHPFRAFGEDIVRIYGGVNGEFNLGNGRFNLHGRTGACLVIIDDDLCRDVTANISSRGLAVCVQFGLSFGVGVIYDPFSVTLYVPPVTGGCRWSPYAEFNVRGRAATAQVGQPLEVRVREGEGRSIRLDGEGGAPQLRVTGPGGQALDSPAGSGFVESEGIRILRAEKLGQTIVALARPGTYRLEPVTGSPAVAKVLEAAEQPPAKVTARVRGRGSRRVLEYAVRRRAAQRVTFVELAGSGAGRMIGTVRRGTLRFTPAPGRGRRRIEAQFELAGLPAERLTVARFTPPSTQLARPQGLSARRRGTRVGASWRRVAGATAYEVGVATSAGFQRLVRTRRLSVSLGGVPRWSSGRVSVRGVAPSRTGRPANARFRRIAPRPTRLRGLPRPSRALRRAR